MILQISIFFSSMIALLAVQLCNHCSQVTCINEYDTSLVLAESLNVSGGGN